MIKKNIVVISICLVLIVILGIGFSYSLWNISVSQDTTNIAESKCFDLSISSQENNINLENVYPINDDKGKSLTPFTFTVTNTCDITAQYSINLEVLSKSTLSSKFIDIMLDGNINLLSSYDETDKIDNSSIESRKIDTGILKSQESKDYSLRLWIDYDTTLEDLNNESKIFKSKVTIVGKPINYIGDTIFNFDYTGGEQTFTAPVSGTYKLETWGAQGGSWKDIDGGYGGYSSGNISLVQGQKIYINVGGTTSDNIGGYNGGGNGCDYIVLNSTAEMVNKYLGGGGATHIAVVSGLLSALKNSKSNILIVSSAGGGGYYYSNYINFKVSGGDGGGITGNSGKIKIDNSSTIDLPATGGTQIAGGLGNNSSQDYSGSFGQGGNGNNQKIGLGTGGGSGYYGGGGTTNIGRSAESGAGGSGYIGNHLLTNKVMYCYNCEESSEVSTKTVSTTCSEETPTSYCAKKGNGYARITLVSINK